MANFIVSYVDFPLKSNFTITPSVSNVNEGSNITFNISTIGYGSGILYWTIDGTNVTPSDFSDTGIYAGLAGQIYINNNIAAITKTLNADTITEGFEYFKFNLRAYSTSGTIIASSPTITINDLSMGPMYSLVVAGGGGGGGSSGTVVFGAGGGGGGGGGVIYNPITALLPTYTYYITVGTGGAAGSLNTGAFSPGQSGLNSQIAGNILSITAVGGGGGGGYYANPASATTGGQSGISGGSGGGGSSSVNYNGAFTGTASAGGTGQSGQGFVGGATNSARSNAGGGGGATSAGTGGAAQPYGAGGAGFVLPASIVIPYITGDTFYGSFSNQYFQVSNNNNSLTIAANDMTFECWIYLLAIPLSGNQYSIAGTWSGGSAGAWQIFVDSTGRIRWQFYTNNNTANVGQVLSTNTWYHVALSRDASGVYLFVNGALQERVNSNSYNLYNNSPIYIGANVYSSTNIQFYFNGYISNLRLVVGQGLYTSGFTPTGPLQVFDTTKVKLLTLSSSPVVDISSYINPITGTAKMNFTANPYSGQSYGGGGGGWATTASAAAIGGGGLPGVSANTNSGGGGGGGGEGNAAGAGADGIVKISYQFNSQLFYGGTVTGVETGMVTHTFTQNGFFSSYQNPTFTVVPDVSSVVEGGTVTYTVTTTNYGSGILSWATTGVDANTFSDSVVAGTVTITNNTGTIPRITVNNLINEAPRSLVLSLLTPDYTSVTSGLGAGYTTFTNYSEGATANTTYWDNKTTFTMSGVAPIGGPIVMHGYTPLGTYTFTYPNLSSHTQVRYQVYWHFVDSLDNEYSSLTINGVLYAGFNKGGAQPTYTVNNMIGSTWVPAGYTYYPFGSVNSITQQSESNGYVMFDTGWINDTSNTFTAIHVFGANQEQSDESMYLSHVTLQTRGSSIGTTLATASAVTIYDQYTIVPDTTSANEGTSVTFTITTYNYNGPIWWTTTTSTGITISDFVDNTTSGTFTIAGNTATLVRQLRADLTTEGGEIFAIQLRSGSTTGTIVAVSNYVVINDTSTSPPTIVSISPSFGPMVGGTITPVAGGASYNSSGTVIITGTGFSTSTVLNPLANITSITFNGVASTSFTVVNSTTITVVPPAQSLSSTTAVSVLVIRGGTGTSNIANTAYTYIAAPTLTSITPPTAGLDPNPAATVVGTNLQASFIALIFATSTQSIAVTPSFTGTTGFTVVPPTVTSASYASVTYYSYGGVSNHLDFNYVAVPPTISSAVTSGPQAGGTVSVSGWSSAGTILISGTRLTGASVTFGGVTATISSGNQTQINVIPPAGSPGTVNIVVTTFQGTSNSLSYTYIATPSLSSITPSVVPGNQAYTSAVALAGANLSNLYNVGFYKTASLTFATINSSSGSSISIQTNTGSIAYSGTYEVYVINPGGVSNSLTFEFMSAPVVVSSGLTPVSFTISGGTIWNLSLSTPASEVSSITLGGVSLSYSVTGTYTISGTTPNLAGAGAGSKSFIIYNSFNQTGTVTVSIYAPASISSLTPATGGLNGGQLVFISASSIGTVTQVWFGNRTATLNSTTSSGLYVYTPAQNAGTGTVPVTVVTSLNTTNVLYFTYGDYIAVSPVISGGGGGGGTTGGGGGGGAFYSYASNYYDDQDVQLTIGQTYNVTIGSGGPTDASGGATYIGGYGVPGGGGGGAQTGGSGGGGNFNQGAGAALGTASGSHNIGSGQGNPGGMASAILGGGGGGAGSYGASNIAYGSTTGNSGGASIAKGPLGYSSAGGGGGVAITSVGSVGYGGTGGGHGGGTTSQVIATNGVINSGGGGGGGGGTGTVAGVDNGLYQWSPGYGFPTILIPQGGPPNGYTYSTGAYAGMYVTAGPRGTTVLTPVRVGYNSLGGTTDITPADRLNGNASFTRNIPILRLAGSPSVAAYNVYFTVVINAQGYLFFYNTLDHGPGTTENPTVYFGYDGNHPVTCKYIGIREDIGIPNSSYNRHIIRYEAYNSAGSAANPNIIVELYWYVEQASGPYSDTIYAVFITNGRSSPVTVTLSGANGGSGYAIINYGSQGGPAIISTTGSGAQTVISSTPYVRQVTFTSSGTITATAPLVTAQR